MSRESLAAKLGLTGPPMRRIPADPPPVPDHELVRCIGQGSYGQVWLARNTIGTPRAVKVVYRENFENDRPYEREFRGITRYEPVSRSNDGLVDILQIGRNEEKGYFYYVLELADDASSETNGNSANRNWDNYVRRTLSLEIRRHGRLPVDECLRLGMTLSLALGFLHKQNLIHRDVKPSNIIFVSGVPKLADIGLVTDVAEAVSMVGTEGFIPPEGPTSPLADIYGLGKVLYEISMGKDRHEFPEPYTDVANTPECDALLELNAVILKACASDPRQRYQSAEELNADLALLSTGHSVKKRRLQEKRLKLAIRASVIAALGVVVASGAFLHQSNQTRRVRELAADNLALAQQAHAAGRESQNRLVKMQVANATRLMDQGDLMQSLLWLADAFKNVEGDVQRAEMHRMRIGSVLERCPKLASLIAQDRPVTQVQFSPDGSRLATCAEWSETGEKVLSVFELASGRSLGSQTWTNPVSWVGFTPDGRQMLAGQPSLVSFVDYTGSGKVSHSLNQPVIAIGIAGQQLHLFVLKDHAKGQIVDGLTDQEIGEPIHLGDRINLGAAFSSDLRKLLVLSNTRTNRSKSEERYLEVYDVNTWQRVGQTISVPDAEMNYSYSPDGAQIAATFRDPNTGEWSNDVQLWSVTDGRVTNVLHHDDGAVSDHGYSPDGRWLITTRHTTARVWDTATGKLVGSPTQHPNAITAFSLSPDGLLLATACEDGFARIWNPITAQLVVPPLRSGTRARCVSFSLDGRFLAVGSAEKTVRVWDLAGLRQPEHTLKSPRIRMSHAAFSRDGQRLLTTGDGEARVWSVQTGLATGPVFDPGVKITETRFSPDGCLAVSCADPKGGDYVVADQLGVFVWDTSTARLVFPPLLTTNLVYHAEFSPDGRRFVTASGGHFARVWDAHSGEPVTPPLEHRGQVVWATFSPDGKRVLTASGDGTAQLWDAETGARRLKPFKHEDGVVHAAFSRDGMRAVTSSMDQTARMWSTVTGEPLAAPLQHGRGCSEAAFSPDERLLLTRGLAPFVQVWEPGSPDPLRATLPHNLAVRAASFSPDGRFILTSSVDATARVWDASTAEPLIVPIKLGEQVAHAEFSPSEAGLFVTASFDKTVRLWRLPNCAYSSETLTVLAQLLYGHNLGLEGSLRPEEPKQMMSAFNSLRADHPELFEASESDVLAWRRQMAEMGARHEQWRTAIWHLDKLLIAAPNDAEALTLRGTAHAELAQWPEAKEDFEAALRLDRGGVQRWENVAQVCLAMEDFTAYRNSCAEALEQIGHEADPNTVLRLIELCTLAPQAVADYGLVPPLIQDAIKDRPLNPLYLGLHGALLYRAGLYREALNAMEKARLLESRVAFNPSGSYLTPPRKDGWEDAFSTIFLALADQRAGTNEQAQAAWQDATQRIETWRTKKPSENGPDWAARTRLVLLQREVEAVFTDPKASSPSPPAF